MKKNIRSKISSFLTSEEGRVSTKAPLALGVATGSVLLAQAILPSITHAIVIDLSGVTCDDDGDCTVGEICKEEQHWARDTLIISSECVPGHP